MVNIPVDNSRKPQRRNFHVEFNESKGTCTIYSTNDKQKNVQIKVNGNVYNVPFDENGESVLQFEKSFPKVKYIIGPVNENAYASFTKLLIFY